MEKSEMGTKIENAFHSIGVEEGFRRGFNRSDLEFRTFKFDHNETAAPHYIEDHLNAGWWLTDKIICPPFVMLIFSRLKEAEEK